MRCTAVDSRVSIRSPRRHPPASAPEDRQRTETAADAASSAVRVITVSTRSGQGCQECAQPWTSARTTIAHGEGLSARSSRTEEGAVWKRVQLRQTGNGAPPTRSPQLHGLARTAQGGAIAVQQAWRLNNEVAPESSSYLNSAHVKILRKTRPEVTAIRCERPAKGLNFFR